MKWLDKLKLRKGVSRGVELLYTTLEAVIDFDGIDQYDAFMSDIDQFLDVTSNNLDSLIEKHGLDPLDLHDKIAKALEDRR